MKRVSLILSLIIGGMIAVITALPLAWIGPHIVPDHMVKTARFHGTIWQGQADMPFGKSRAPITFKTSPIKLFTGQDFLNVNVRNSGVNLRGWAGFRTVKDIDIDVTIARLPLLDPRIRGLQGKIEARISKAKFGAQCQTISGQVKTNFFQANEATWFWQGPEMSGPITCKDGDIIIDMNGDNQWEGQRQVFSAQLRLKPSGLYEANMEIDTKDVRAAVVLGFYGFEARQDKFVLSEMGRWY